MFPKRERGSQLTILGPDHLDFTHLEASLCPLRSALQVGPHTQAWGPLLQSVSTLWTSGRQETTLSSSPAPGGQSPPLGNPS